MRIFVSGPYTGRTESGTLENTISAIDAGIILFQQGHFPFIPHLAHWMDARGKEKGIHFSWDAYMVWSLVWLLECEAMLYLGPSPGADIELRFAKDNGIEIYYNIDDIPEEPVLNDKEEE